MHRLVLLLLCKGAATRSFLLFKFQAISILELFSNPPRPRYISRVRVRVRVQMGSQNGAGRTNE